VTTLVIGFGNSLAGDDAAGPEAVSLLRRRPGLIVRIVEQLTTELAADIAAADRVVFVDASTGGTQVSITPVEPQACAPDAHVLSPQAMLHLAGVLFGRTPPAVVVAIPGQRFEMGDGLSAPVRRHIPRAVDAIEGLIRASA
jgi:hydrogenase maturation protease